MNDPSLQNQIEQLPNKIKHLYKKSGYLERYGIQFYITLFIILVIVGHTLYYHIQSHKKTIKANWIKERCKPEIIPFAGFIHGGTDAEQMSYTLGNFTGCINGIFTEIAHDLTQGLEFGVSAMGESIGLASEGVSDLRNLLSSIRTFLEKLFGMFSNIFINVFTVIMKLFAILHSTFGIATGALTTSLFAFMTYVEGLQSLLSLIILAVLVYTIIAPLMSIWSSAVTVIGLCAIQEGVPVVGLAAFTWCVPIQIIAATMLIIATISWLFFEIIFADLLILIEAGMIYKAPGVPKVGKESDKTQKQLKDAKDHKFKKKDGFTNLSTSVKEEEEDKVNKINDMSLMDKFRFVSKKQNRIDYVNNVFKIFNERRNKCRKVNLEGEKKNLDACFDGNTILCLRKHKKKRIQDIEVGDVLFDGSTVTAWMELSTYGQNVYNCQGTLVTGNHRIYDEEKGLTEVKNHSDSFLVDDYRHDKIYCINTDSKQIYINGLVFTDWDDLDDMDFIDLKTNCSKSLPENFKKSDIHKYLDGGFIKDTLIELESGNSICIKDIQVNDILRFGERVVGIVKINARDLENINEYYLGDEVIKGSSNLPIIDEDLDISNINDIEGILLTNKVTKLYHILTDRGCFIVNGIRFGDYNTCLENYIDNDNFDFLSILF
jgi:hypothetical protein